MRLGAYQLIYLDRVPEHAIVHQAVELARRFGHRGVAALVNAVLRRLAERVPELPWPDRDKNPLEYLVIRNSQPRWLAERRLKRYGLPEAEQLGLAENRPAPVALRYNCLRITRTGCGHGAAGRAKRGPGTGAPGSLKSAGLQPGRPGQLPGGPV